MVMSNSLHSVNGRKSATNRVSPELPYELHLGTIGKFQVQP